MNFPQTKETVLPVRMPDEEWGRAHQLLFAAAPPLNLDGLNEWHRAAQAVFLEAARLRAADKMSNYYETVAMQMLDQLARERDAAYHERSKMIAFLATAYGDQAVLAETSDCPGYGLAVIQSEKVGQMSWHIAEADFSLFPAVVRRVPEPPKWDGHSTDEKYTRLWALAMFEAGWRWFHAEQSPEAHTMYDTSGSNERPY